MRKQNRRKLAEKIYKAIKDRISEKTERAYHHDINIAYLTAFEIGLISDIEEVLNE